MSKKAVDCSPIPSLFPFICHKSVNRHSYKWLDWLYLKRYCDEYEKNVLVAHVNIRRHRINSMKRTLVTQRILRKLNMTFSCLTSIEFVLIFNPIWMVDYDLADYVIISVFRHILCVSWTCEVYHCTASSAFLCVSWTCGVYHCTASSAISLCPRRVDCAPLHCIVCKTVNRFWY